MTDELHEKIRRAQIAAGEKVVCEYLEKSGLLKPRALAEDDIPVGGAMIDAGAKALGNVLDVGSMKMGDAAVYIYRAMERVRRAEADAEVIRRSVKQD
jgi:hypothetical protein